MTKHNEQKDWKKIREQMEQEEANEQLAMNTPDETVEEEIQNTFESNALEHLTYHELEEKLTLAEQKSHENWEKYQEIQEKYLRASAEFQNAQQRAQRELKNAHLYGNEKFIKDLLSVGDSLEQALQLVDGHTQAGMKEGLELTMKLFLDALNKQGVEQINPEGEPFDPQSHEAMSVQTAPGVKANTVVMVIQKGYKLNDRVIRPARVIVAKSE